jgi:hypothetical protein
LRARPAFQAACCELLTDVRRASLAPRIPRARPVGGGGGASRPIALQSHDPQRYVSDMLAWTHQAIASEIDLVGFVYRYFLRESCSQFDSLPLTSLTTSPYQARSGPRRS